MNRVKTWQQAVPLLTHKNAKVIATVEGVHITKQGEAMGIMKNINDMPLIMSAIASGFVCVCGKKGRE